MTLRPQRLNRARDVDALGMIEEAVRIAIRQRP
jgi:hypothetical protein